MCKNGWIDRFAVCVVEPSGPKDAQVQPHWPGGANLDARRHSFATCAEMAEPTDLPFGLWSQVGRRKHKFNRTRQVAPMFPRGRKHIAVTWRIRLNHPSMAAMCLMSNYFDHLLYLDTPIRQIAERFEPNTALWAFHTIQPSSCRLN